MLRRILPTAVILSLLSVNTYGLFSSEMMLPDQPVYQTFGSMAWLLDDTVITNGWNLSASSSYLYQTVFRDSLRADNLLPNTFLTADIFFIPGFLEYDDTGLTNSFTPFSGAIEAGCNFHLYSGWKARLRGHAGIELAHAYDGYPIIPYGAVLETSLEPVKNASLYLGAGFLEGLNYQINGGGLIKIGNFVPVLGAGIEENAAVLRAGLSWLPSDTAAFYTGIRYSLETSGLRLSLGTDLSGLKIFGTPSSLGCSVDYFPSGWFSFHLTAKFFVPNMLKNQPKKDKTAPE